MHFLNLLCVRCCTSSNPIPLWLLVERFRTYGGMIVRRRIVRNEGCACRMLLLLQYAALIVYYVKTRRWTRSRFAAILTCAIIISISSWYRIIPTPIIMKGSAATQAVRRSVNWHRISNILGVVLLVIYKKACVTLNWFIWEWLLGLLFLIIWRMFWMRAWCSVRLLLFVLLWYLFLLAYHVFLRLSIGCSNISHFLTYNSFLKMMVDNILFRLLLFNIVEGLMHPT